jgi:hypothetical protein
MKSVLYVAAALMIGASIYGFVGYSKTKGSKEFDTMYNEKKASGMVIVEERKSSSNAAVVSKKELPEPVKEKAVKTEEVIKKSTVKKSVSKSKKKRKVSYKSFSRAPLREEVVEVPEVK